MPSIRRAMIENQLNNRGISDQDVINAFLAIDRTEFVPAMFKRAAYMDIEIPFFHGVILRPFVLGKIAQFISNSTMNNKDILVIGDVSGYTSMLLSNISRLCIIGTINSVSTEYLRDKVPLKVMQICDIKEKFDLIFFDSGFYKEETITNVSQNMLKQNGCVIKISENLSSDFAVKKVSSFDVSISADFASESVNILQLPLFLNSDYIA